MHAAVSKSFSYEGIEAPEIRIYRNLDQGHRRYMDEKGNYIPTVVYQPANPDEPLGYYDFDADKDVNGLFEPPTTAAMGASSGCTRYSRRRKPSPRASAM